METPRHTEKILLSEVNPYGSLEAVVEDDGRSVYLYLRHVFSSEWSMRALWLANRAAAPGENDITSMAQGIAPLMPAAGTRHPDGVSALPAEDLSLVWFEEGDGVALLQQGRTVAILPPWAGFDGFPGYCASAVGEQALAWELDARALQTLRPRVSESRRYWEWRAREESWGEIRGAILGHLEPRLGTVERYWAADGRGYPPRAVALFHPPGLRGVSVYATVGMSAQRMPQVEMHFEDPAPFRRIELVLASRSESDRPPGLLSGIVASPWREYTWLGDGHTYSWEGGGRGPGESSVLLLKEPPEGQPGGLFSQRVPAPPLAGLEDRSGDRVTFLWVLPVTPSDRKLAEERGAAELVRKLGGRGRAWVWS